MIILDYLGETSIITKTPLEGSTGVRVREGDGKTKAEVEVMPFENGKRSFEPKNVDGLLELEKAKRRHLS